MTTHLVTMGLFASSAVAMDAGIDVTRLSPSTARSTNSQPPSSSTQKSDPLFSNEEMENARKEMEKRRSVNSGSNYALQTNLSTTTPETNLLKLNPDSSANAAQLNILPSQLRPSPNPVRKETPSLFLNERDLATSLSDVSAFTVMRNNAKAKPPHSIASMIISPESLGESSKGQRNPYEKVAQMPEQKIKKLAPVQSSPEDEIIKGIIFVPYENFIDKQNLKQYYALFKAEENKLVSAVGFPNLDEKTVQSLATPYLGRSLNIENLDALALEIKNVIRQSNQPFANIYVPEQTISDGVIILVVRQALLQSVELNGNSQFKDAQIKDQIRLNPGDFIRKDKLEQDIAWLNLHPNRNVNVAFSEGDEPNTTKIDVNVEETKAWRVFASSANDGTETLDKQQYTLGAMHNNLWNADHRVLYQYGSSIDSGALRSHNFMYTAPLPWRDLVSFSVVNSKAKADLLNGSFESSGRYTQYGIDYDIPLLRSGLTAFPGWALDDQIINLGLDKKSSEGNVLFTLFGAPIATGLETDVEVFNISMGYSGKLMDPLRGTTTFQTALTASPGNLGSKNDDTAFERSRSETDSRYAYATMSADRLMPVQLTKEGKPFELATHIHGQVSNQRLIGSERMLGGLQKGFRGYQPDAFSGDYGYGIGFDLMTPYWQVTEKPFKSAIRLSAFADTGLVGNIDATDNEESIERTLSTGLMLNYIIEDNLSTSLQLSQDLSGQDKDRVQNVLWRMLLNY